MNESDKLKKINNKIKIYINESSFISLKCRNKIIKILADIFSVNLPLENYERIDISLTPEGNIIMRDDLYKSQNKVKNFQELEERFNSFCESADAIINKNSINFNSKSDYNNIKNILILLIIFILFIILLGYAIKSFLRGDLIDCIWLILFIIYFLIPKFGNNLKERIASAKKFIKKIFK